MINTILEFFLWAMFGFIFYVFIGYDVFEWTYIQIAKRMKNDDKKR